MDYRLRPIGKLCALTGAELLPGSRCRSALVERDGQMQRIDALESAWKGPPEGTIGHWRIVVPETSGGRPKAIDVDAMMRTFEQMQEDANPGNDKFLYLLTLLLLQKKRLQIVGSRDEDETTVMELVGSHGEGPWEVRDQKLAEAELTELQSALTTRLAEEFAVDDAAA